MSVGNTSSEYGAKPYNQQPSAATLATASTVQLASPPSGTSLLDTSIPGIASSRSSQSLQSDFNNDGQEDLLWRNYATGDVAVWLMNQASIVTATAISVVKDLNWRIQGTGDFTGDRNTDILWRNYANGQNAIWVMNGTQLVTVNYLPTWNDSAWQAQGVADFNGDQKMDVLWRNYNTGQNQIWLMNGVTRLSTVDLPTTPGVNLTIEAIADLNQDGNADILWRNYLSGDNLVWLMNGTTVSSTITLTSVPDLNWQMQAVGDFNDDGKTDIFWRNLANGQNGIWLMNGLSLSQVISTTPATDRNWQVTFQETIVPSSLVTVSKVTFNGKEGAAGQFQIQLNQAPRVAVNLTFRTGTFVVVDADNNVVNGSQSSIRFTPQDWSSPRTVSFIAEADGSASDRLMGNTVSYSLAGGLTGSGVYDLGPATNTYSPDPNKFNIDLDFRNDYTGFWTPARRAIAQRAADDWASAIANEWSDLQLNSALSRLDNASGRTVTFNSKRYVDDLLIFINPYLGSSSNGSGDAGLGGPDYEFGGWVTSPTFYGLMPRVGQIAINPNVYANQPDQVLYQVILHEIGHVLGLVGLNWMGYTKSNLSNPTQATFQGEFARQVYGGNIPLQSQENGDFYHPASTVPSIMSYGYIYGLSAPSQLDYAMLADSGYQVYGVNA